MIPAWCRTSWSVLCARLESHRASSLSAPRQLYLAIHCVDFASARKASARALRKQSGASPIHSGPKLYRLLVIETYLQV
jgi:hypothetical protein